MNSLSLLWATDSTQSEWGFCSVSFHIWKSTEILLCLKDLNNNVKYYVYASAQEISEMDHLEHPGNMKVICNY